MKAPHYDVDFYSDEFINDPYPHYEKMRALGPVVWLPQHENFALTQHAEVRHALRDHTVFVSGKGVAGDQFGCDFLQGNTVASDGPKHSELRRAMAPPLLPGALKSIEGEVQQVADTLIEHLVEQREFDAISDLARHLPLTVVRDMVGLPEMGQDNMLRWAAAAFNVLGMQNERGKSGLKDIAQMRTFIQRDATRDKLKKGSWTHRVHDLVDEGTLACEHAAFAIRDYINPSLDTTISATGELIYQLARNPQQWVQLKQDPTLINNAVNEAVRLGTPIRSFSRHTSRDVEIADVLIPRGERVMMLFASANRDERTFPEPDEFRLTRNSSYHVGFGSGIHMCVGMHLAQLEMEALLKAMIPRVAEIDVVSSTVAMNNTIRAFSTLTTHFSREEKVLDFPPATEEMTKSEAKSEAKSEEWLEGRIVKRNMTAKDIVHLVIEPSSGQTLPKAEPGAHIDVHLCTGLVRQYSLTGSMQGDCYEIAVQREPQSRGGSNAVHDSLDFGAIVRIGEPRNNFRLKNSGGTVLLLAGGIGLTPLWSMAWELHRQQRNFELHISTRSRDRLAFADQIAVAPFESKIETYFDDENEKKLDVGRLISKAGQDSQVYTCGPRDFMDYVVSQAEGAGLAKEQINLEHFGAEIDADGDPFTVVAQRSGKEVVVEAQQTILEALRGAGIELESSCENGVCGRCLVNVIDGRPDHRDLVQTESEKAANTMITICCSRSVSKTLILDI